MPSYHHGPLANFPEADHAALRSLPSSSSENLSLLRERLRQHFTLHSPTLDFTLPLSTSEHALLQAHFGRIFCSLGCASSFTHLSFEALPAAVVSGELVTTVVRSLGIEVSKVESLRFRGKVCIEDLVVAQLLKQAEKVVLVDLGHCVQVSDRSVQALRSCGATLRCLDLTCCYDVSGETLHNTVARCEALEELSLAGCTNLADETVATALKRNYALRKLDIAGCLRVSNRAFLLQPIRCVGLQTLVCTGCVDIDDQAMLAVFEKCTALRLCHLAGLRLLTDKSLVAIPKSVREVDVSGCFMVSDGWLDGWQPGGEYRLEKLICVGCVRLSRRRLRQLEGVTVVSRDVSKVVELDAGLTFSAEDVRRKVNIVVVAMAVIGGCAAVCVRAGVITSTQSYYIFGALLGGIALYYITALAMSVLVSGM